MRFLKRLLQKVEVALTAAAFAEESEAETARRIVAQAETPPPDDAPSRR